MLRQLCAAVLIAYSSACVLIPTPRQQAIYECSRMSDSKRTQFIYGNVTQSKAKTEELDGCSKHKATFYDIRGDKWQVDARKEDSPMCYVKDLIRRGNKGTHNYIGNGLIISYRTQEGSAISVIAPNVQDKPGEIEILFFIEKNKGIPCEKSDLNCEEIRDTHLTEICSQIILRNNKPN